MGKQTHAGHNVLVAGVFAALSGCSTGERVSLASSHVAVVDAAQQHGQFLAADFGGLLIVRDVRHLKRALLQPPIPNRQTVAVPVQNLQLVATTIDKQKQMPAERILLEHSRHDSLQSIKSLAHVRGAGGHEDARAGGDA